MLQRIISCFRNNFSFVVAIFIYWLVQIWLVVFQYINYIDETSKLIKLARCCGILLNFNSSLIILLVLRKLTTLLRNNYSTRLLLPLDDFIDYHKSIGIILMLLSLIHTLAHCLNLCKNKLKEKSLIHI